MLSLYVYFKVTEANSKIAKACVEALLEDVKQLGISAEFWRKEAIAPDGTQTWMTIFQDVAQDFEMQLQTAALAHGLTQAVGALHIERFVRC